MKTSEVDIKVGQSLGNFMLKLEERDVSEYVSALGGGWDYGKTVPPIILVAKVVGHIVEQFKQWHGAIHFSEKMDVSKPSHFGETVTAKVSVSAVRKRSTATFLTILKEFTGNKAGKFMTAETTIVIASEPN